MIEKLYLLVIAIAALVALIFVKRNSHKSYKILAFILVLNCYHSIFVKYITNPPNYTLVFYNMFFYFIGISQLLCYYYLMPRFKPYRNFFYLSLIIYAGLAIYYFGFTNSYYHVHTTTFSMLTISTVCAAIFFLFHEYQSDDVVPPMKQKFLLTSAAWIIFYLCNFPMIAVFNDLLTVDPEFLKMQRVIATFGSIIMYPIISFDIYNQWKQQRLEY